MLDTIKVKFPIEPTEEDLKTAWTLKSTRTQKGEKNHYIYNPVLDEVTLRFTYIPVDYSGKSLLSLEFSLPKLLFNNNHQMIQSIDGAIKIANLQLASVKHVPHLDLAEGILMRLDMCYNHQVGDAVDDYINAIGNLDYPHRRTKYHRHEGTEFKAKHKTTKFYNKEHESGLAEAHGILRQEITILTGKDVQKFLGTPRPTLLDVSREIVKAELENDLQKLGLLNNSIANRDTAFETLSDTFGEHAGPYYFGILVSKNQKSRKRVAKEANMHPRSIDRKLKKMVDAGIPLTLTDQEEPLPPLIINL